MKAPPSYPHVILITPKGPPPPNTIALRVGTSTYEFWGLDSIANSMDMNLSKLWKIVEDRGVWCAAVHGVTVRHDLEAEQQP